MTCRTRWSWIALAAPLLLTASSCSKSDEPKPADPKAPIPEITAELKKGEGIDLVFGFQQQDLAADGSRLFQAHGKHKGVDVGLIVALGAKWESVTPDPKQQFAFHTGSVEYRSLGAPSDALLAALDELYGTKLGPMPMRAATKFAGASLQGDPDHLASGELRLKLTFESADPAGQAELYTNIDLATHRLRICEKDASYRAAIIKALRKE